MTHIVGELEKQGGLETTLPLPVDQAMIGAVALYGTLNQVDLDKISDRLQIAFDNLRADDTKETGSCIALALPQFKDPNEEYEVDSLMLEIAKSQNHGMQTLHRDENLREGAVDKVWAGLDPHSHKFLKLYKRSGLLYMNDESFMNSTLWALKAQSATMLHG